MENPDDFREDGTPMTEYIATAIAEGFCEGEGASDIDQLRAWGFLIRTGFCWSLQGWFGRSARDLIDNGLIDSQGVINWPHFNYLKERGNYDG